MAFDEKATLVANINYIVRSLNVRDRYFNPLLRNVV